MQNIDTFIRDQTILTKILDEAFSYCSAKKILVVYGGMHFKTGYYYLGGKINYFVGKKSIKKVVNDAFFKL